MINDVLTNAVNQLSDMGNLKGLFHEHHDNDPLPSGQKLGTII